MGHNSKKKKKKVGGGSGRRSKGRATTKEISHVDDNSEIIADEITALCAIFQEDCKIVSHSPPEVILKIRPYSKDSEYEDSDVSCCLLIRCSHGYPFKCPKLQITPERGLLGFAAENLLSLLHDQANTNAREGRVTIFNLAEIAQEYLTEIVPMADESATCSMPNGVDVLHRKASGIFCSTDCCSGEPFVYGFTDLFGGLVEGQCGVEMDDIAWEVPAMQSETYHVAARSNPFSEVKLQNSPLSLHDAKQVPYISTSKLDYLKEESESNSMAGSRVSLVEKFSGASAVNNEDTLLIGHIYENSDSDLTREFQESVSFDSIGADNLTDKNLERDLVMVHLLRIACASEGRFDVFSEISRELYDMGIFSEFARDLASKSSSVFNTAFGHVFREHMASSKHISFWNLTSNFGKSASTSLSSRYLNDFEELQPLGHGGFGHVVLCSNKLDGRQYAMKKIRLKDRSPSINDRILREVATLSRLQHQHVVRYYQAWFETGVFSSFGDTPILASRTLNSSYLYKDGSSADPFGAESKNESTLLYIQMEYCPRTLRQVFETYNHLDQKLAWHLFHQIVEGLAHIHGHGIIHRDLTPNNIFFDTRNDVKIGDFGLAKFLKLEQLEQDQTVPVETCGLSVEGTGQVGTYFYTAPEIEHGWPKIDEKADMYSLGIVFFELWHPFGTAMERHIVLSDLTNKGELPSKWVAAFPEQALLLRRLISPRPSERPSATELLQHAFPPRMEFELLDNMLRTMQTSEDTSIYDKVVNAIFDDESLRIKYHNRHTGTLSLSGTGITPITEDGTELRDCVIDISRDVFELHCAKHLDIFSMRLIDEAPHFSRKTVKLLSSGGGVIEVCHELRLPFIHWVVKNQKMSYKRYDMSFVYRKAIGYAPPNRYLQGDFDIIGGDLALTEAEVIKVSVDILTRFFSSDACVIHLNHADLMQAIWSWVGVKVEHRRKVAELLSLMASLRPESSKWKSKWVVIRRQLLQELHLAEAIVNRLQTVGLRFCGPVDQAVPRLRGALPRDRATWRALDGLSDLLSFLRIWKLDKYVFLDALMPPSESYHRDLFFQIYLVRENVHGSLIDGVLLGVGGRYDYLLKHMWGHGHKAISPGGVGVSLGLQSVIEHSSGICYSRRDASIRVLICSRGGGGLLKERMELVSELWEESIKAEFVPMSDPSLREQYEYADEHGIRCLIIINDGDISRANTFKFFRCWITVISDRSGAAKA